MIKLILFIHSSFFTYFLRFSLSVIILFVYASCQAPAVQKPELLELDYYFGTSYLQIQGISPLPPEKIKRNVVDFMQDPMQYTFLMLSQRRKLCIQTALRHAHTKFLSISQKQWATQSEWNLRLKLGAKGGWHKCLQRARIMNVFYDIPDHCRLVVWYNCDPRNY